MRVTINQHGMMTIEPETHLEVYALKSWMKENESLDCKNLTIKWGFDNLCKSTETDKS